MQPIFMTLVRMRGERLGWSQAEGSQKKKLF